MKHSQAGASLAHQSTVRRRRYLNDWLEVSDFQFDPFDHLDASSDPHLNAYLVDHEAYAAVWEQLPALVFAPAGSGKTTMRIYATRGCYAGVGEYHPFPLPYLLSDYDVDRQPRTAEDHLVGIVEAGVRALFVSLAWRPGRFLDLSTRNQQVIVQLFERTLGRSFSHYMEILRDTSTPYALTDILDSSYGPLLPSATEELQEFCEIVQSHQSSTPVAANKPTKEFNHLIDLLTGPLGFSAIFLLIDGVDAFPETSDNIDIALDSVAWLIKQAAMWAKQNVYIKGFLPFELENKINERLPGTFSLVKREHLRWTTEKLVHLLQRRITVATNQKFNSLDAISSNPLVRVERMLVQAVKPLPREALVLAQRVLFECANRLHGQVGKIAPEDVDAAIEWYQDQQDHFAGFAREK